MFCAEWRAAPAIGTRGEDGLRVGGRPLERLHRAHRAADDAEQLLDAEMVDQQLLRPHHVADGDDGEAEAIGLAGARVDLLGPVVPMQPPSTLAQITK